MKIANTLPAPPPLQDVGKPALFLDFDGTLIEIAGTPDEIEIPAGLAGRLEALSRSLDGRLAVVSGRSIDDLNRHIGSMAVAKAGSHGASRLDAGGQRIGDAPSPLPDDVVSSLSSYAERTGLTFEGKSHGAALHYRRHPSMKNEAVTCARELAAANDLVTKEGKAVIEIVRRGADKAGALDAFMQTEPFTGATPIFIGDDVTDEDGFRAASAHGGFGIAVGERASTHARYHLNCVDDVYEWTKL